MILLSERPSFFMSSVVLQFIIQQDRNRRSGFLLLAHKTQIDAVVLKLHVRLYELKLFIIRSVHYSGETEGSKTSARKTTK